MGHFWPKKAQKSPCFQEIPLFASSIYFTLPEIVMGPIWVPNASINTSWAKLKILITGYKTISQGSTSKLIAIVNTIENRRVTTSFTHLTHCPHPRPGVSASLQKIPSHVSIFPCIFSSEILKFWKVKLPFPNLLSEKYWFPIKWLEECL